MEDPMKQPDHCLWTMFQRKLETPPIQEIRPHGHFIYYLAAIVTLFLGLGIGYLLQSLQQKGCVHATPVDSTYDVAYSFQRMRKK